MTTMSTVPENLLQEQIDTYKSTRVQKVAADIRQTMQADTEALVASGIAAQALQIGQVAPDFTLPDATGKTVTLSQLVTQQPVVLTFYRGGWCPYCNLQLRAYQQVLPQIEALGGTLVAVSPQKPDQSLTTAEKNDLAFIVLSDVGNQIAREYGLVFALSEQLRPIYSSRGLDIPAYNGDDTWELPMPGLFIIDQQQIVRFASVDADYTNRVEPAEVLRQLEAVVG